MQTTFCILTHFVLLCLLSATCFAQTGNCVVFSTSGESFHLGIDNKFQNAQAHNNVKITNIPEGDYWVTVLFHNKDMKAVKTSLRVIEDKEISYQLALEGGVWKLNIYSTVPKNQVKALSTGQTILSYNKTGVEAKGLKDAQQIEAEKVAGISSINRVQGDRKDHEKRMGQYSGTVSSTPENNENTTNNKTPETGTTVINEYIRVENTDGTSKIVDQRTTIVREIVERNGQKQLRTKKSSSQLDTDFTCIPMSKDKFLQLKASIENASDKLNTATSGIKEQCLTPNQIKAIAAIFEDKANLNTFATAAQSTCASPTGFPLEIEELPVVVKDKEIVAENNESKKIEEIIEQEKEIEEKIIEEHKTEAQLKAELKALKAKAKLEKKIARQKAKLAKQEAKRKAKEAKAKEKEAAKRKKEAEKAAS